MKKTSVMIVDDHAVVRMGLAAIIGLERDMAVCGVAGSGAEAVRMAATLKPDVVVMDLVMPDMDGADTAAEIAKSPHCPNILILTTFGMSADIARALAAGAKGAITKDATNDELVAAIHDTAAGVRHLSPEIRHMLDETCTDPELTPRQLEILASITRGLSNDDIAVQMGLSKSRIKQHLNEMYVKLGAANRAEAVAIAMRRSLAKL